MDLLAEASGHVDQGVDGEFVDAAAEQVVNAGLGDAAVFGGGGLSPTVFLHDGFYLTHQNRASFEVSGFFGTEA